MPGIKSGNLDPAVRYSPAAKQARRRSGLRKNSFAIFVMLLAQYGLGMGVNLYAPVPAADHGNVVLPGHPADGRPAHRDHPWRAR
jgi:hypothetical protein